MQAKKWKSIFFVTIQFGCLAYLVVSAPLIASIPWLLGVEILGVMIGVWAVLIMLSSKLSVFPEVQQGANMVQQGPYRLIRHPMYTSLIITLLPLVITYFTWIRLLVYFVLVINQLFKLHYEEKLLTHHFDEYAVYQSKTYRILPFVW